MQVWIDADACPNVIKEILFRAAIRTNTTLTLVANHALRTPPSALIHSVQVPSGFDVADNYIVKMLNPGDLIITADIPLAAEVIAKDGHAINPRGERYTKNTIQQRLSMRNFMEEMRNIGQASGGPPPLNKTDQQTFANALDGFLTKKLSN